MSSKVPVTGSGAFGWNAGGWWGSQIGGTAWMLAVGIVMAFQDIRPGAVMIAGGIVSNIVGTWLWCNRDRVSPYRAIQTLLAVIGVCAVCGIVALDAFGHVPANQRLLVYWWLVFIPGLMLMFHLRERAAAASKTTTPRAGRGDEGDGE